MSTGRENVLKSDLPKVVAGCEHTTGKDQGKAGNRQNKWGWEKLFRKPATTALNEGLKDQDGVISSKQKEGGGGHDGFSNRGEFADNGVVEK